MISRLLLFATIACISVTVAVAEDDRPVEIQWKTLAPPEGEQYRDAFSKLTRKQIQGLSFVARIERLIAAEKVEPDGATAAESAKIARKLNKEGIDVPGLLAQRSRVALMRGKQAESLTKFIAKRYEGKRVSLTGYAIPVKVTKGRVTEFLLVSSLAMCSHEAVPPANRLVHVVSSDGIENWSRMKPVMVTGKLKAKRTTRMMPRPDGPKNAIAAFAIVPQNIELVKTDTADLTDVQNDRNDAEKKERPSVHLNKPLQRIAFGSCTRQMQDAPLLNTLVAAKPDLFLMLGDVIYPDINDAATELITPWPNKNSLQRIKQVYAQMAAKPEYQKLKKNIPMMAVWDDHDYGINDGGADFPLKAESQQLFLDFFDEPSNSKRRRTPGIYDARTFGPEGRRVQVILLDTRYFRTPPLPDTRSEKEKKALNIAGRYAPNDDGAATVLGETQWRWLERQFRMPAEVRLLVSSYPLVPYELGRDCWGNCPRERKRLFKLIGETKANGVIVLSGDVHFSEISRTEEGPYPLVDFTSSALAAPSTGNEQFKNSFRISKTYSEVNFGFVEIDWDAKPFAQITLQAIGLDGSAKFTHRISLGQLHAKEK